MTMEGKKHEIMVKSIMKKIKIELDRRKTPGGFTAEQQAACDDPAHVWNDATTITHDPPKTAIWRFVKKVQYKLQKFAFYDVLYFRIAVKFKSMIPKYAQNQYGLEDLLKYHDLL